MKKDKLLRKLAQEAVKASCINEKINSTTVRLFVSKFEKLPLSKAIFCLSEYRKGLKRILQNQTLTIESALPLSKIQFKKIENLFKNPGTSIVESRLNSSLLGGIRVTMGDSVFDGSISSKIQRIGEAINAQ